MPPFRPKKIAYYSWALGCVLCAVSVGCQESGPKRAKVYGVVKYQGEPVENGVIRFVPQEIGAGPMAGALIKEGRYEVTANGGVPLGLCRVEIIARRTKGDHASARMPDVEMLQAPGVQYMPAKYNEQSELTVEIASTGEVKHDFDLE